MTIPSKSYGRTRCSSALAVGLALALVGWLGVGLFAPSVTVASSAVAAGSPMVRLALPFGSTYGSDSRVHSGIDVSVPAGTDARSATAGTVTFAGLIPASSGALRMGAVSVEGASGSVVTVSPIDGISVARGDHVTLGQSVGLVGAQGDASTTEPHLHLSERVDGRYVDPTHLLGGWLTAYGASQGAPTEVEGGALPETAAPGSPSAVLAPMPSVQHQAVGAPTPSGLSVLDGQLAWSGIAADSLALTTSPLALLQRREFALHPLTTLGQQAAPAGADMTPGPSGADLVGDGSGGSIHVGAMYDAPTTKLVVLLRYFGAGLAALAAGLGFALHIVGGSEKRAPSHRMGS